MNLLIVQGGSSFSTSTYYLPDLKVVFLRFIVFLFLHINSRTLFGMFDYSKLLYSINWYLKVAVDILNFCYHQCSIHAPMGDWWNIGDPARPMVLENTSEVLELYLWIHSVLHPLFLHYIIFFFTPVHGSSSPGISILNSKVVTESIWFSPHKMKIELWSIWSRDIML